MADERTLPAGLQAGPNPQPELPQALVDEMNVANPTLDISTYIRYTFYLCELCKKKEFAGALDKEPYVDCTCTVGEPDPKTKKFKHGRMRMLEYKSVRPGQEHAVPQKAKK